MGRPIILTILALVLIYGLVEAWPLLSGPRLTVTSPKDGQTVAEGGVVDISGTALRTVALTLDGTPLLADAENGHFATTLAFPPGTSILTFSARDRFGRSRTTTRTIYVTADASVGSPTPSVGAN